MRAVNPCPYAKLDMQFAVRRDAANAIKALRRHSRHLAIDYASRESRLNMKGIRKLSRP